MLSFVEIERALVPWYEKNKLSVLQIRFLHRLRRSRELRLLRAPKVILDREDQIVGESLAALDVPSLLHCVQLFEEFAARYRKMEGDQDPARVWAEIEHAVDRRAGIRQAVLDRGYTTLGLAPYVDQAITREHESIDESVESQLDYLEGEFGIDWMEDTLLHPHPDAPGVKRSGN